MGSFEVTVAAESGYLRVTTVGNYEFNELFGFLADVKAEAESSGMDKVLIDSRRLSGSMTEAEKFHAGQKIAELFGSRIKIAVLMPTGEITKLGELVASNRGARFHVSSSESEGIDWLLDRPAV